MSLEDKFEEVRQLIIIGKEKGYLLYDEVNDVLPAELTSNPEDLDELFTVFGNAGIDLVDTEKGYRERDTMERGEGPAGPTEDGMELDLTPGALTRPTTRCGCTCARWAPCRCSPARARWPSPSASSAASSR